MPYSLQYTSAFDDSTANTKSFETGLFPPQMPPHVLMNFRGFPPGCGDSVADFWGWDAHEARLRCPDDVSGDMQEDEIPGGALSLNSTNYPGHGHHGNLSLQGKIPMVEPAIEPGDLMISSQRPWPLDHEARLETELKQCKWCTHVCLYTRLQYMLAKFLTSMMAANRKTVFFFGEKILIDTT